MTKITVYPHTVSQTSESGTNYSKFNNLSNVKNNNDTYAKTKTHTSQGVTYGIASKSGTHKRPSAITAKNFKCNIPTGSKINSVTVEYAADYEGNISIGKSTINILNITGDNKSGKALTKTMTKTSVTWNGNHTVANMNSSDFGVKISFPANTKADVGYVKVKYIRIIVDYTAPNFSVSASKVSGTYTEDEFKVKVNVSNVNKTNGSSNVNIQLPSGVTYTGKDSGDGSITQQASTGKLTWTPHLSSSKFNSSIVLKFRITTNGGHNFNITESATGHKANLNISTSAKPAPTPVQEVIDTTPETQTVTDNESLPEAKPTPTNILQVGINEEFSLDLSFEDYSGDRVLVYAYFNDYTFDITDAELFGEETQSNPLWTCGRTNKIYIYSQSMSQWAFRQVNSWDYYNQNWTKMSYVLSGGLMQNLFKITDYGYYTLMIHSSDDETLLKKILISVRPDTLTGLVYRLFKLSEEELNRLGHEFVYTVQSHMKLITSEPFVREYDKNFKIGIFNNRVESNIYNILDFVSFSNVDYNDSEILGCALQLNSDFINILPSSLTNVDINASNSIKLVGYDDTEVTVSEDVVNYTVNDLDVSRFVLFEEDENKVSTLNFVFKNELGIELLVKFTVNFDDQTCIFEKNRYDSTDYSNLTNDTIAYNAAYWSDPLDKVNEFVDNIVEFPYDENYPVYVLITGDYSQGNPLDNTIQFTHPCIIESDAYSGQEPASNYPLPILSMISDSAEEPSVIQLSSFEESTHVIVYNPVLPEDYGTDDTMAIRGIKITADIDFTDDLILFAKLKVRQDNQYLTGNRSVVIDSNDNNLVIGGDYDTWGLNISELVHLDKMELELGVNNILKETDATIFLKNIYLTVFSNEVKHQGLGIIVEDENVAWYGMDVTNIEIPFGRNSETKYLNVEGTDTNVAYRQNIRGKTIKIYFDLDGCDLKETTAQVQQLAKLFTNKRDELNAPIPKKIRFTHIPAKFFYFILEDTFDTDIRISDYKGSVELFIPEGTAFDVEDTVTNINGFVDGIASVNPIIALTHITGNQLTISELVNNPNQVFKINKDNLSNTNVNFEVTDTIIVNCITRTCSLVKSDETETIDISEAVDFNSDWFKIQGEFEFKSENCVIQTVTYNTRS